MKDLGIKLLYVAGFLGIYILGCGAISAIFPESTLAYIIWAIVEWKMFQALEAST